MAVSLQELGDQLRAAREDRRITQEQLAKAVTPPTNRSAIAHLEQGLRIASPEVLQAVCEHIGVPAKYWKPFTDKNYLTRLAFEEAIAELVGRPVTLRFLDEHSDAVAQESILAFFKGGLTDEQALDTLNSLLVFYDVQPMTLAFFRTYLSADAAKSPKALMVGVERFQADAIRLFGTFAEGYAQLNSPHGPDGHRKPLAQRDLDEYRKRASWDGIEEIEEGRLPDLGYISAALAKKEKGERQLLADFLRELAAKLEKEGKAAVEGYSEKKRRHMSSLLRKFEARLNHDLMSPLFAPDPDAVRRQAEAVAPKADDDLERIAKTQAQAQRNLARYLAADYLDVYVATSMRTDADFVSVNRFVNALFSHDDVRPQKLRYFNPTQSWIDDRVAKGLVEALMLRRSSMTIYLAQKSDSFGKDSEASVALGMGKPVIVYVPKLSWGTKIDSEALGRMERGDLERLIADEGVDDDREPDPTMDQDALVSRALTIRLGKLPVGDYPGLVRDHWADFDLYGEDARIEDTEQRAEYRRWLDVVVRQGKNEPPPANVLKHLPGILVAIAVRFEGRARLFRVVHPLALQVILSTGVLNGILVARSIDSCAQLIERLLRNALEFELDRDEYNYRLIEKSTRSTMRVISRHTLITNAFGAFYSRERAGHP